MTTLLERFMQASCQVREIDPLELVDLVLIQPDVEFTAWECAELRHMAERIKNRSDDDLSDSMFSAFGGLPRPK